MAISPCPICGRLVSDSAPTCSGCGLVINGAALKRVNAADNNAPLTTIKSHTLRTTLLQVLAAVFLGMMAVSIVIAIID